MDYSCRKFGDCSFSHFGIIVRTNRHTHTHTHTRARRNTDTDAAKRCTSATVITQRYRSAAVKLDPSASSEQEN